MIDSTRAIVEQTFKQEYGRVLATLIGQLGDFDLAEDALQDALIAALEQWPRDGTPHHPGAWLTTIAKRRAIDRLRRDQVSTRKQVLLQAEAGIEQSGEDEDAMDTIPDERLKLMFTCCHPSLSLDAQVALTLRTLGGLSTAEIARAFLVSEVTMAQRLTRVKGKIRNAGIPYAVPPTHLLPERLDALLAVIYLIFNEGHTATSGDSLIRHELCNEAIRLGRVLIDLLPNDATSAEARGLLALMLLHDSRRDARVSKAGELVVLEDQDRSQWDQRQIREGLSTLDNTLRLHRSGPYQVQAAISALHAEADEAAQTDWPQIAELYRVLASMSPSPVIEVNRAVAVAMTEGPLAGLRLLDPLWDTMNDYYPFHAARADLLRRNGEREAAAEAYQQAIELCPNSLERAYLQRRLSEMSD